MAGNAQDGSGAGTPVPDVRRRGRGRGNGAHAVREASDEAPAGLVPEQDAVAAPADQGHVGNRPGPYRQGGHVRRRHRVLRDPVPGGRRPGDRGAHSAGRTPAAGRPSGHRILGEYSNDTCRFSLRLPLFRFLLQFGLPVHF